MHSETDKWADEDNDELFTSQNRATVFTPSSKKESPFPFDTATHVSSPKLSVASSDCKTDPMQLQSRSLFDEDMFSSKAPSRSINSAKHTSSMTHLQLHTKTEPATTGLQQSRSPLLMQESDDFLQTASFKMGAHTPSRALQLKLSDSKYPLSPSQTAVEPFAASTKPLDLVPSASFTLLQSQPDNLIHAPAPTSQTTSSAASSTAEVPKLSHLPDPMQLQSRSLFEEDSDEDIFSSKVPSRSINSAKHTSSMTHLQLHTKTEPATTGLQQSRSPLLMQESDDFLQTASFKMGAHTPSRALQLKLSDSKYPLSPSQTTVEPFAASTKPLDLVPSASFTLLQSQPDNLIHAPAPTSQTTSSAASSTAEVPKLSHLPDPMQLQSRSLFEEDSDEDLFSSKAPSISINSAKHTSSMTHLQLHTKTEPATTGLQQSGSPLLMQESDDFLQTTSSKMGAHTPSRALQLKLSDSKYPLSPSQTTVEPFAASTKPLDLVPSASFTLLQSQLDNLIHAPAPTSQTTSSAAASTTEVPKLSHLPAQHPQVRGRSPPEGYTVFHKDDSKQVRHCNCMPLVVWLRLNQYIDKLYS